MKNPILEMFYAAVIAVLIVLLPLSANIVYK